MSKEFEAGRGIAFGEAREDVYDDNADQGILVNTQEQLDEEARIIDISVQTDTEVEQARLSVKYPNAIGGPTEAELNGFTNAAPGVYRLEDIRPRGKALNRTVDVLDKGYVRYVDHMGTDLNVVNAARASYAKESLEFDGKDEKLLNFLVRENHTAPFRHAILSLEIYAPLFVARQWWKHVIGGTQDEFTGLLYPGLDPFLAWNESSRRYVTETPEFYLARWRGKPANNKQGSADFLENMEYFDHLLESHYEAGLALYEEAMAAGIAPEQARLFLGANGLYVRWRWTSSLQGVQHFIRLRDEEHAQWEIQEFARGVKKIAAEHFPVSIGSL